MHPKNWARLAYLISAIVLAAVTLSICGCGGVTTIPNLPAVQATTDKDVRASIAKAYAVIGASLAVVDKADQLEATINASGAEPAAVHAAAANTVVTVTKQLKAINDDLDHKSLTTWAAIQARVQPVVDQLNTLLNLVKGGGFSWTSLFSAVANLLADILVPVAK